MCGIIGIFGFDDVSREMAFGLTNLQHRGQDASGIVTFDGHFRIKKGNGLVGHFFTSSMLERLKAPIALGHVRYATQGDTGIGDAQPIYMNYPFGLAMVHNGNVVNFQEISQFLQKEHRIIETTNDLELMLYTLASHLERQSLRPLTSEAIFSAVKSTQQAVKGAYSAITILANHGMLAFTDPSGIRPLSLGKKITSKGPAFAFASESSCLESLGYHEIQELEAGEAVYIDPQRRIHTRILERSRPAFCIFETIYFAREDTYFKGKLVAGERVRMGRQLAEIVRKSGINPDVIIDVPSSAFFFASGLAEEMNIPYRRGLSKNKYVGRSFLFPTQNQRSLAVRQKLSPLKPVIRDKNVAVVDDSIVRGNTSKHLVELLRLGGARQVHFISAAPPICYPCFYGIDMSIRTELIAAHNDIRDIARFIGADSVIYQSLDNLRSLYNGTGYCDACFSGEFPVQISRKNYDELECERHAARQTAEAADSENSESGDHQ